MLRTIKITDKISLPSKGLRLVMVRSSGPGGQNINKTSTKVKVFVQLSSIQGVTSEEYQRLAHRFQNKLSRTGEILFVSQRTRSQLKNLEDVLDKIQYSFELNLLPTKSRIKTKTSRNASEKRINTKKLHGQKKKMRKINTYDE